MNGLQFSLSELFFFSDYRMTESLMVGAYKKDMNALNLSYFPLSFLGFFILLSIFVKKHLY